jgi:hypothetical protein
LYVPLVLEYRIGANQLNEEDEVLQFLFFIILYFPLGLDTMKRIPDLTTQLPTNH